MNHGWNLDHVYISKDFRIFKVTAQGKVIGLPVTVKHYGWWKGKVRIYATGRFKPGLMSRLAAQKFCSDWGNLNSKGWASINDIEKFKKHVKKYFKIPVKKVRVYDDSIVARICDYTPEGRTEGRAI